MNGSLSTVASNILPWKGMKLNMEKTKGNQRKWMTAENQQNRESTKFLKQKHRRKVSLQTYTFQYRKQLEACTVLGVQYKMRTSLKTSRSGWRTYRYSHRYTFQYRKQLDACTVLGAQYRMQTSLKTSWSGSRIFTYSHRSFSVIQ